MRSLSSFLIVLTACSGGDPDTDDTDTDPPPTDVEATESDFPCMTTMESTGRYRFTNLIGLDAETRAVATSPDGGTFPLGTLIQLIPGEAMVKRGESFSPETNNWEFFTLAVSAEGAEITARGGAEVDGVTGANCFACHSAAEPQWDLVCGADHGCMSLGIDQDTIQTLQENDPRCP